MKIQSKKKDTTTKNKKPIIHKKNDLRFTQVQQRLFIKLLVQCIMIQVFSYACTIF